MAATSLFDLAAEWLTVLEAAVATTPGGAIARAFVSAGPPAFDCCPQLTVHSVGGAEGPTSPAGAIVEGQRPRLPTLHLVGLEATVVRCVDVLGEDGTLPTALSLETTANQTMSDLWAILNFTRRRIQDGTLFASASGKREVYIDPQAVVNTSGGCAGWIVPIRVTLGGYSLSS